MKEVTYAFGEGLVSSGWRVEITTASSEAPIDLNAYDLLVLGTPVYGFRVTPTIERHLERMGDLKGIDTLAILTAAGSIGDSSSMIEQVVVDSNGTFLKAVILYSMAPNQNDVSAMLLAEQAAKSLD
jgi:flavorubredoxin